MIKHLLFGLFITPTLQQAKEYRKLDGSNSRLADPTWALPNQPAIMIGNKSFYADAADGLRIEPNARDISIQIAQLWDKSKEFPKNPRKVNEIHAMFGQFFTHDMFTMHENDHDDISYIPYPANDYWHTDKENRLDERGIPFERSKRVLDKGMYKPVNINSPLLDGSAIYPAGPAGATLREGKGGRLKVFVNDKTGDPLGEISRVMDGDTRMGQAHIRAKQGFPPLCPMSHRRSAGDHNANLNAEIPTVQTIFIREHNRLVAEFAKKNPTWDDETLFQEARRMVVAFIQRIADREYLPALLGEPIKPVYTGFNASVNPQVTNFFGSGAFRYGHSEMNPLLLRLDKDYLQAPQGHLPRFIEFFGPDAIFEGGPEIILRGLSSQIMREVSPFYINAFWNQLFANPQGTIGYDLFVIDVMRGRDHGVPAYNDVREALGLPRKPDFSHIPNPDLAALFTRIYKTPDQADAMLIGLAEACKNGTGIGETFVAAVADHFRRVRDADYFWYENPDVFTAEERKVIEATSLSTIIQQNFHGLADKFPRTAFYENSANQMQQIFAQSYEFPQDVSAYTRTEKLDDFYQVSWNIDKESNTVKFLVQAYTSTTSPGWVGIGFVPDSAKSEGAGMVGSDIVIATMDDNKAPSVKDYYVPTFGNPIPDTDLSGVDNLSEVSYARNEISGLVVFSFKKPFKSGDKYDIEFKDDDKVRIIFAMGNTYEVPSYHGATRGSKIVYIYRSYQSKLAVGGSALLAVSLIALVIMFILFGLMVMRRDRLIVKATGIPFYAIICVGLTLCLVAVIVNVSEPSSSVCYTRRVLFPLGYSIVMAGLIVYQFRIRKIFNNKNIFDQPIPVKPLAIVTSVCLIITGVILIIWSASSPSLYLSSATSDGQLVFSCVDKNNDSDFVIALHVANALFLLAAVILTLANRDIGQNLKEAAIVGYAVFHTFVISVLVSIIANITKLGSLTVNVFNSVFILYSCIFFFGMVFGTKVIFLFTGKDGNLISEKSLALGKISYQKTAISSAFIGKKVQKENGFMLTPGFFGVWVEVNVYQIRETGMLVLEDVKSKRARAFLGSDELNANIESMENDRFQLNIITKKQKILLEFSNLNAAKDIHRFIGNMATSVKA